MLVYYFLGCRPLDKAGGAVSKKMFSALRASVWSKNKGEEGAGPLGPSPGSATVSGRRSLSLHPKLT